MNAEEVYRNSNTGYVVDINDKADLLTDSQEKSLLEIMMEITDYGHVCFLTEDNSGSYSSTQVAKDYLNTYYYDESATVFFIDMYNREIIIDSTKTIGDRVTSSYANTITDNVYKYAHEGDYFKTASEVYSSIGILMKGGKIAQPLKIISNILLAIAIGFIVNFCIILSTYQIKPASYKEIINKTKKRININNLRVVLIDTMKTYSPQSSGSSSGGSRGGGGGGGHSSGGHSF
ncbi:MAG: TPM domain-containing protein [Lachnospiraceae bacterium]|nr:TPM domain-containing protein [Lachnospiraceae bacterium]